MGARRKKCNASSPEPIPRAVHASQTLDSLPLSAPSSTSPFSCTLASPDLSSSASDSTVNEALDDQRSYEHIPDKKQTQLRRKECRASAESQQSGYQQEPEAITKLIDLLAEHRNRTSSHNYHGLFWHKLPLDPAEFHLLRSARFRRNRQLGKWILDRLRVDYSARRQLLTLRIMPTHIHEIVQLWLNECIGHGLRTALKEGCRRRSADRLKELQYHHFLGSGHADIKLPTGSTFSPDAQFGLEVERFPCFVVEVGYSEKSKDLEQLAADYWDESGGQIRTVLTIDLNYQSKQRRRQLKVKNKGEDKTAQEPKSSTEGQDEDTSRTIIKNPDLSASVCLYRGPDRIEHDKLFCGPDGSRRQGDILLNVADFLPPDHPELAQARQCSFNISLSRMFDELIRAEAHQAIVDRTPTPPAMAGASSTAVHMSGSNRLKRSWAPQSSSEDESEDAVEDNDSRITASRQSRAKTRRTDDNDDNMAYSGPRASPSVPQSHMTLRKRK